VRICDRGLPTHQIKWKSEKLFVDACTDERTPQLQSTRSSVGDDLRVETRHPMEGYLWPPYVIGQAIYIFSFCCLFFLFSSPNLSGRKLDVCHTSSHGVALVRTLGCRSETCCTRLAGNVGRKKSSRHLRTIVQLCRAMSSQLRHVSTIGKNLLSSNTSSTCPDKMVNFGPLAAEIDQVVWGT